MYIRKTQRSYSRSEQSEIENEVWKECSVNDNYQVSNLGRVRGKSGRILHPAPNKLGYCIVNLDSKSYSVHRLVATAFIDNPNNYKEIDHINRDKNDNRVDNLRWCDRSINCNNRGKYRTRRKDNE